MIIFHIISARNNDVANGKRSSILNEDGLTIVVPSATALGNENRINAKRENAEHKKDTLHLGAARVRLRIYGATSLSIRGIRRHDILAMAKQKLFNSIKSNVQNINIWKKDNPKMALPKFGTKTTPMHYQNMLLVQ